MADDADKARQELAATIEGRSDDEIVKGVEVQGVETVLTQIFGGMTQAFLPDKAGAQSTVIQYDVTASGKTYTYQLKCGDGKCELVKGAAGPARVTLNLALPDFLRLVTGKLNGMQAFMAGKLKIAGDMMFAQVMQGWFRQA